MKNKSLVEIKHGERIVKALDQPMLFADIMYKVSLDRLVVQKVLADLQKHGYISKNERSLWVATPGALHVEETRTN